MKISVVIINYNYALYISQAIQSVLNQKCKPDQIVIVDDGSKDNSVEIIESFIKNEPKIQLHSQPNSGQLAAIRSGIERASGDWIFFLDSDDEWAPDHLEQARSCLTKHPDVSLYFSNHQETAGRPIFRSKWPAGKFGPCSGLVAATGTRIGTIESTLGLRADKARESISFDRAIDSKWRMRAEDCLIFGASLSGAVAYYNSSQTVKYRIHGDNSFAHRDQASEQVQYQRNKDELFSYWFDQYGIKVESLKDLINGELLGYDYNLRNASLRRRSRRAQRAFSDSSIMNCFKFLRSKS